MRSSSNTPGSRKLNAMACLTNFTIPCAICLASLLVGCGARSGLLEPSAREAPLDAGSGAGGGDASVPGACPRALVAPFAPSGPTGFACSFDGTSGAPAFVAVVGPALLEMGQDTKTKQVFTFFSDMPALLASSGESDVVGRGHYYAAI